MYNVSCYGFTWHTFKKAYINTKKRRKREVQENDGTLLFPPLRTKGWEIPGGGKKKILGKYVVKYSECYWKSSEVFGCGRVFFKISSRNPRKKNLTPICCRYNISRYNISIELNHLFGNFWLAFGRKLNDARLRCLSLPLIKHLRTASCF